MAKKRNVIIETGKDGFWGFLEHDGGADRICINSYGKTVSKCMDDFLVAYNDVKEFTAERGEGIPDMELNFIYDVGAFFNYYPLNVSAFAKYIGMNPSLMRQYASGVKEPREKNLARIREGIGTLMSEVVSGHLIEKPVLQYV